MGDMELSQSELDIDLESGGNTTEEDENKDHGLHGLDYAKEFFSKDQRNYVGLNTRITDRITSPDDASSSGPDTDESLETLADRLGIDMVHALEKKANEKRRKTNSKNPSKPPRPPKGPSIGTADMKMVKEISELATLKRKRMERMKVLSRMKSKKASSCDINLCAMVFTILFFFVIIFQGFAPPILFQFR